MPSLDAAFEADAVFAPGSCSSTEAGACVVVVALRVEDDEPRLPLLDPPLALFVDELFELLGRVAEDDDVDDVEELDDGPDSPSLVESSSPPKMALKIAPTIVFAAVAATDDATLRPLDELELLPIPPLDPPLLAALLQLLDPPDDDPPPFAESAVAPLRSPPTPPPLAAPS